MSGVASGAPTTVAEGINKVGLMRPRYTPRTWRSWNRMSTNGGTVNGAAPEAGGMGMIGTGTGTGPGVTAKTPSR